jgi:putative inorganic carbon (HCO3(-)) transporter
MRLHSRLSLSTSFRLAAISLALVPPVTYLTFVAGVPVLGVYYYPGRIRAQLIGAVILGGWLLWKWVAHGQWPRTAIDLPIVVLLAVIALSTAFSTDPRRSLEGLVSALVYVLAFYFLLDVREHRQLWKGLLNAVVIVAGITCALALVQLLWWYRGLPAFVRESPLSILQGGALLPRLSVLGNPNFFAVYLLLVLPLSFQRWLEVRRRALRWVLGLPLALSLLAFALTGSRGGMLGLAASAVAAVAIAFRKSGHAGSLVRQGVVAGAVLLTAAGVIVLIRGGLGLSGFTAQLRLESWSVALDVIANRAILGSGPGTFGTQVLRYGNLASFGDVHSHAHNLYVTLAAETGVLGMLALLWVGAALVVGIRGQQRTSAGFTVTDACIVGLVGRGAHSLVDTFLEEPVIVLLTLLLCAAVTPVLGAAGRRPRRVRLVLASVAFALMCAASGFVDYGFAAHHAARESALAGDWEQTAEWLDRAVQRDPAFRLYEQEAAFSHGVLACGDAAYLEAAIARYHASLQSWPNWPLDHANLSVLLAQAGDHDCSMEEAERACELDPTEPLYACYLGLLLEEDGQLDQAIGEYASCVAREPALLTSSFWQGTAWRMGAWEQIIARAEAEAISSGGVLRRSSLRNYAGLFEDALADAVDYRNEHSGSAGGLLQQARALSGLGRFDEAVVLLDELLERDLLNGPARMLRGQIRLRQGDLAAAARDIDDGAILVGGREALYWQGVLAQAQGESGEALVKYEAAIAEAMRPETTQLAPSLAGRLPLPVERLPCLAVLRPRESFLAPALALASILERGGRYEEAAEVYRLVVSEEPYSTEAVEGLEGLLVRLAGG